MEADYTAVYADLYQKHWWWRVREQILVEKVRETLKGRAPHARILDVGCGAGVFFEALEQFGHVEGIESDPLAVEQSEGWRSRIHAGQLDDTFRPGHSFDLILLLDVLEHVPRPDEMLRCATRLLSPEGRIIATVPAFTWLWTSHDDVNHHLKRYTAAEMRTLMKGAGLAVVETRYLFQSLVLPKLLVRAKEMLVSSDPSIPRIPSRGLNRALQLWYRSEYAIGGWLPFGSSVLALAQRVAGRSAASD
jgi:2-polyprenyl-3-methyl-5-hydroxy-6-metoxy-1,4-benzoquinol methylase